MGGWGTESVRSAEASTSIDDHLRDHTEIGNLGYPVGARNVVTIDIEDVGELLQRRFAGDGTSRNDPHPAVELVHL